MTAAIPQRRIRSPNAVAQLAFAEVMPCPTSRSTAPCTGATRHRSTPAAVVPQSDRASAIVWVAILAAMIGAFMAILNIQITNASLLNIEGGIGTGVDNGSWISTSYLIGEIVVIPLTDYLSRVFSFRNIML